MMGLSLETKAEEIYLALLQAIVCGTRAIIEQCGKYGVTVSRVLATGGIAGKNPLLMQEYANVLNVPVDVGQVSEGPALGAAIYAAVAAGLYAGPVEAHRNMGVTEYTHYLPDPNHRAEYEALYRRNRKFRDLVASFAP
jgi:L-ribulokinase